ncbi:eukaryotic translation initiation factor 3 subunit J [Anopheles aquasalis]|uniref:eukaryotic translation initiation factor 3 subunit J n=1 Tax=Anopheles aquasalis TaxID=42839 RepID=UPI00215AF3AD|nr:eukaryotic translation initiation factor 3 subunit J [Anopheles aquasalis]
MEEDWEQLADQKANDLALAKANANKWAGEDEDDVKDNWEDDDEEEEKKDESKSETPTKAAKPKKTAQQKLLEKEKLKELEEQRRREEEEEANMTPEQRAAEKRRLQKLQEENDLKTAMETLGITPMASGGGTIDGMHPTNKEEFSELAEAISKKLSNYRASTDYQGFLEELLLKLFASVPSADIRKAKNTLDNLYLEKQKVEKGDKPKKTKSSKVKVKLRMEGDNSTLNEYKTNNYDDFDEYDDFM